LQKCLSIKCCKDTKIHMIIVKIWKFSYGLFMPHHDSSKTGKGYWTFQTQDTSVPKSIHETPQTQCQSVLRHQDTPIHDHNYRLSHKCPDTSVRILWVRSILALKCPGSIMSSSAGKHQSSRHWHVMSILSQVQSSDADGWLTAASVDDPQPNGVTVEEQWRQHSTARPSNTD